MQYSKYSALAIIIIISIFFTGCKEDSNPTTPQTPHFEAEGLVIQDVTKKIFFAVYQGQILKEFNGIRLQDTLVAPLNALSDHYDVKFLNDKKEIISAPTDKDHTFGFSIDDKSVLDIYQHTVGEFAFHLKGLKIGKTNIVLMINHLGHADFKTPKIPVKVILDTTKHGEPIGVLLSYEESGQLIANATLSNSTGTISVKLNDTTDHIKIQFYDANNIKFQPDPSIHSFDIVFDDATVSSFIKEADEPWVCRFIGKKVGTTYLTLKLKHQNEVKYTFAKVKIEVK